MDARLLLYDGLVRKHNKRESERQTSLPPEERERHRNEAEAWRKRAEMERGEGLSDREAGGRWLAARDAGRGYQPRSGWRSKPVSVAQTQKLRSLGLNPLACRKAGEASNAIQGGSGKEGVSTPPRLRPRSKCAHIHLATQGDGEETLRLILLLPRETTREPVGFSADPAGINHSAKQKLATHGVTAAGTDEARFAALVVAAELRLQGVSEDDAQRTVARMPVLGASPPRRLLRQMQNSVNRAYTADPPFLSGCCRDPRPRTGSAFTSKLRGTFAAYCDDECARTCSMLRAIRNPDRSLLTTPYEPLERSNLWLNGGGLGNAGQLAFRLIAQLAVALDTTDVQASGNYICMKSNGAYSPQHLRKALGKLHDEGIVTLLDRRTGLRRVHARDETWIAAKEQELGVHGKRERNVAEARKHSDEYRDWLARELASFAEHERDDALAAWNPAPEKATDEDDPGRPVPRFLRAWGGSFET